MSSCPICLEDLFQPPTNKDAEGNGNVNGNNNSKNSYNIGATVPCGHLYHYDCFDSWRASQASRRSSHNPSIKCPTCNLKTKDFTRLYLDVASINGLICQRTGSGDDDISLSSIEDDDDDESEENNDEHEHDKLIRAQDPTNNEHDEFINHAESISNEIESVGIHVQEENNAKISIETLTAREQQSVEVVAEVVDLTISPSTRQLTSTISSQSNDDPRELERVTRIAKKFKRQFLQKNLQYKEQYNEKRKISERVRQVDKELLEMQGGMDELDRDQKMTILHLKESRLSLQRTVTERDMLKSQYLMMEEGKSKLDNQLKKCHLYYGKELEKARMKSMSEVQQILEEHPKVVEENRILKKQLQKLNQKSNNNVNNSRDISKALRQMDHQVRSKNIMPSTSVSRTKSTNRIQNGKHQTSSSKNNNRSSSFEVSSGQYSSTASRMMTASSSSLKAKKSSQNAFVREMLSSSSRDGINKTSESKKRSSTSSVTASRNNVSTKTSLSLSQNKRMKSNSDARRGFFQRKTS
mmetsp:Transcript_34787/g.37655  ORF Transcript_34787/g.37655 Transcript_34787/m.37655 type:complete len:525 (+) Transcript_34787:27-1601(+)